jgi:ectoine hydroxylase-related dioxygenase (phytanoyl-CoA dioxygenase family)
LATDLATVDRPISKLFPICDSAADAKTFRLTREQLAFFHEYGYLADVPILTEPQMEQLRDELAEMISSNCPGHEYFYEYHSNESANPDTVLFHALGAWRVKPAFHDVLWNAAMTIPAAQLLGGSVRFWHDQLFVKPAKHGGVVAWHQDYSYWTRTAPMAHLTCWVGLDDAHKDNGCMYYVPGSHRWDLLPITGLAGNMDAIRKVLTPEQLAQFENPVPIELKAGHATFHHPLLIHGSFENRTAGPRRAVVINMVRDGVRSLSDQPLLNGVPVVPTNQELSGKFFPLLIEDKIAL